MNSELFLQLDKNRYYPNHKKLIDGNNHEIILRPQSLEVLHLLASKQNQVISKDEIFSTVWSGLSVTDDSLVQCISDIRHILKDDKHKVVQTFPRRGYRLSVKQSPSDAADPLVKKPIERPSIAVMGFENIGSDHTGDVIAVGLSTDIHLNLAKMSRLFVVAQASACQVQRLLSSEIGEKLGVRYLIQGSIQRCKTRVRVTITLVEAETTKVLWSERYERPFSNFFQLQDDITLDVVMELDHCIEQEEIKKAFSVPTESLDAWQLYHQGLWYCTQSKKNLASIENASRLLNQSLALDPGFAPAYAALSSTFISRIFLSTAVDNSENADKALDCAYQCLEHEDRSGWGYWALGRALYIKRQHSQALEALNLSIKYKPNFTWNHYTKAIVGSLSTGGDDILPSANHALRLSPVDPLKFSFLCAKAHALIKMKDYEAAASCGVQAIKEPKTYHLTYVVAALALKLSGQSTTAKECMSEAFNLMPKFSLQNYRNSLPYDDEESADRLIEVNTLKALGVPEVTSA